MPDPAGSPASDAPYAGVPVIGMLHDAVRRAVYRYAVERPAAVSRNEVAQALAIGRTLAAFHLDKLADAGLLEVSYARRSGAAGPGAGRPAKLYRRAAVEHAVSLPPRDYRSAATILAGAVDRAGAAVDVQAVAREYGESIGRERTGDDGVEALLSGLGYEPVTDGGVIRLANCPFQVLARQYPPLICGMNLALIEGILAGAAAPGRAVLDPGPERCCVAIHQAPAG
jgi:predicted ArsR family transcriptional regulator